MIKELLIILFLFFYKRYPYYGPEYSIFTFDYENTIIKEHTRKKLLKGDPTDSLYLIENFQKPNS